MYIKKKLEFEISRDNLMINNVYRFKCDLISNRISRVYY